VLYTPDMLPAYPAMRFLSGGDQHSPALGRPIGIRWLRCDSLIDDEAECDGHIFALQTGLIERRASRGQTGEWGRLRRAVIVEDGRVVRERDYPDDGGRAQLTMEIIRASGKVAAIYLLDGPAFESTLNQMYVLGRFDGALFEEVYNDFPYVRVFRVRTGPR